MNASELLQLQYQTMKRHFLNTLKDLNSDQLIWRPEPTANSISFLLWHVLRAWDLYWSILFNCQQLYEKENWPQKFGFDFSGRGFDDGGMGTGFTSEDVAMVVARQDTLMAYFDALLDQLQAYLKAATDEDLDQEFIVEWWPTPSTVAGVLSHVMSHGMEHIGQAQYVRGLLEQ